MGRAHVIFKCISCRKESATEGPICKRARCAVRFALFPEASREQTCTMYANLRVSYLIRALDKRTVQSRIAFMQEMFQANLEKATGLTDLNNRVDQLATAPSS